MSETSAAPGTPPTPTNSEPAPAAAPGTPSILGDAPASAADPAKPADPAQPAAPVVPESYEFKAPEVDGKPVDVDTGALDAFRGVAKDMGLTQEQFQALGEHGSKIIGERVQAAVNSFMSRAVATQNEWRAALKADPEIGGEKTVATIASARAAMTWGNDPEFDKLLDFTDGGRHPPVGDNAAMVRFLAKVGAQVSDPRSLSTGKPAGKGESANPEQQARNFYNQAGGNYPDMTA